jgi:hypothetical protein
MGGAVAQALSRGGVEVPDHVARVASPRSATASVLLRAALSKDTGSNYLPIVPRWVTVNPSGDLSPYPSMRSKPECATQSAPSDATTGAPRPMPTARSTVPKA